MYSIKFKISQYQKSSKVLLYMFLEAKSGSSAQVALLSLDGSSLVSASSPFHLTCMHLPFGAQGRSWRPNEVCFLQTRFREQQKVFVPPEGPTGSCSISRTPKFCECFHLALGQLLYLCHHTNRCDTLCMDKRGANYIRKPSGVMDLSPMTGCKFDFRKGQFEGQQSTSTQQISNGPCGHKYRAGVVCRRRLWDDGKIFPKQ